MYCISSKRVINIANVQSLSLQFDILCTSAVKLYFADTNYSPLTSSVFPPIGVHEAKNSCYPVVRPSVGLISYSGELCNKKSTVKTCMYEMLHHLLRVGSEKPGCNKSDADQLLKSVAMVFRVHSKCNKFLFTY